MAQGKRLRRGMRAKVNWAEVVATDFAVWRLRRLGRTVLDPVTPDERAECRRLAEESYRCDEPRRASKRED